MRKFKYSQQSLETNTRHRGSEYLLQIKKAIFRGEKEYNNYLTSEGKLKRINFEGIYNSKEEI